MLEKELRCLNPDGYQIAGKIFTPEGAGTFPTVICSHGFTGNKNETIRFVNALVTNGYQTVVFDFCGGGFEVESEGSFEDYMTPFTECGDLKSVYNAVKEMKETGEIYLLGCSQGGFVSTLCSSDLDIAGLILMYPALCIPDDARKGSMQVMQFDPKNIPDHIGTSPMRVSGEYPRSVINMDIYEEMKKYHGPVYLAHGTADEIVPFSYAERAAEVYKANGNAVAYCVVNGGDHGFRQDAFLKEAIDGVLAFFKR